MSNATVIRFPSHRIGLKATDKIAQVSKVVNGIAKKVRPQGSDKEYSIIAQHKRVFTVQPGNWVRIRYTGMGIVIEELLSNPGCLPIPKVDFRQGKFIFNRHDPVFRLYRNKIFRFIFGNDVLERYPDGSIKINGKLVIG